MPRDHNKLRVFQKADALVVEVYRVTRKYPIEERYGLQGQTRRAAVSAPNSLVEGCARRTTATYLHFVDIAAGSASEARYLIDLGFRLDFVSQEDRDHLVAEYTDVVAGCQSLMNSLEGRP